ncbi:restriction endonuclease [Novosphingobium sp. BL-8A]
MHVWPFSKKRNVEVSSESVVEAPAGLTPEQMEQVLLLHRGEGAHFSLFYANLNGHEHEVITPDTIHEFIQVIQAEPNFTENGRTYAANRLASEADFTCRSDVFELLMFGHMNNKNQEHKGLILAWRNAVRKYGFADLCARIGFDHLEFLERATVSRRQADLNRVYAKLEERKQYLKPLLLRAMAKGRNKYGEVDYGEYVKEVSDFFDYYFPGESLPFFFGRNPILSAVRYLKDWVSEPQETIRIPLDGIDFEHWCAARLEEQGWAARVSQASGDQGVDIEAMKDGKTVAIQCKRYAQVIGNKAIQEAYAGMMHYRADAACVIGTGGYTASAIELGNSTGVLLIDAENISEFSYLVESHAQQ